jgi:hypothetical protein
MQSSSSDRPFKPNLDGASPSTDANFKCSQGVISSARRSAKAEVHGANPCGSTNAFVPQQLQEEFCKLPVVGASPTEGSISFRIVV